MKIEVLGSGCSACAKLNEIVNQAAEEMGLKERVEYLAGVEGTSRIIEMGAMSSPVLAINDQVATVGFIADIEKIKQVINKFRDKK